MSANMWSPTHAQVTVQRARGLLVKGKNGTNNCFVTIALGKEKYQTSVKEKAEPNISWNEECELKIPDQGNRAELVLTCLHHNSIGLDEFLGQVTLPLNEMDVYDRPRSKWFKLESKPGKEKKSKDRGELEVRIAFIVKSGSLIDLSKKDKHKSSVSGSLLSIGTIEKRKALKNIAKSLGSKMHLNSKKKHKDANGGGAGDDASSFSGSYISIGTPNSSNGGSHRRYGQRPGEADPGVISEDEDEFVFDNLSHKSSGSSLNIQRTGLQPPLANFAPHQPSPLLKNDRAGRSKLLAKLNGGKPNKMREPQTVPDDEPPSDVELGKLESDLSVRARTLPAPSKPPRTAQTSPLSLSSSSSNELTDIAEHKTAEAEVAKQDQQQQQQPVDEWATKLYSGAGKSDSLKRRSWEQSIVPLPKVASSGIDGKPNGVLHELQRETETSQSSSQTDESDAEPEPQPQPEPEREQRGVSVTGESAKGAEQETAAADINIAVEAVVEQPRIKPRTTLLSPDIEKRKFDDYNASFAKFEQRNSDKIFEDSTNVVSDFIKHEKAANERAAELAELAQRRAAEDARLEAELRYNEQRLKEEEAAAAAVQRELDEQRRRELKRQEEDLRILNFAKRATTTAANGSQDAKSQEQKPAAAAPTATATTTMATIVPLEATDMPPEQTVKELAMPNGNREKLIGKFKYLNKRDKQTVEQQEQQNAATPKSTERIIIGHERAGTHTERRAEISAALLKKYEGKSREELMLIANGMENDALFQRQRVKELEDYLDNLLLRVMETHPKILQNPYSRTASAKSYKNFINMNDFLK